jgi:hypothetical protein
MRCLTDVFAAMTKRLPEPATILSSSVIPGRAKREPGIPSWGTTSGFRVRAKGASRNDSRWWARRNGAFA